MVQNGKSIAMFGNLKGSGTLDGGIFSPSSFLKCLLNRNDLFEEMIQSVADGLEWRRMVWIEPPQAAVVGDLDIASRDKDEELLLCGESRLPSIDITASSSSSIFRTPDCRPFTPRPSGLNFHQLDVNSGTGHLVDINNSQSCTLANLIEASGENCLVIKDTSQNNVKSLLFEPYNNLKILIIAPFIPRLWTCIHPSRQDTVISEPKGKRQFQLLVQDLKGGFGDQQY